MRGVVVALIALVSLPAFAAHDLADLEEQIDDLAHEIIVKYENGFLAPFEIEDTADTLVVIAERYTRKGGKNSILVEAAYKIVEAGKLVSQGKSECDSLQMITKAVQEQSTVKQAKVAYNRDDLGQAIVTCSQEAVWYVSAQADYEPAIKVRLEAAARLLK